MSGIGHNSKELDRVAKEARKGLKKVHENEEGVIEGWLIYGAARNEGREMFPSDKEFGQWLCSCNLQLEGPSAANDAAAAMWAAANLEEFEAIKEANPRVRTVRGLHAKWKEEQKANKEDNTDNDVVDPDEGGNDSKPGSGNSPSGQGGNTGSDDTLDDVVDSLIPKQTGSVRDAEKAILEFNSLSDEEKINRLGGRPDVVDQRELDQKLEEDYNPLNSATAVLVSLNRLRIYGGKLEIERNIMQVLSKSSRMKSYEAEALVLLGEVILENREELLSVYSNQTDLNKLN